MTAHLLSRGRGALAAAMLLFFSGFGGVAGAAVGEGDYCSLPGELVTEDAQGDATTSPVVEAHDVEAVWMAEPQFEDGVDRLVVTLKVGSLSPAPAPNSVYYVHFGLDDGILWHVSFRPYVAPGGSQFNYGRTEPPTTPGTSGTLATLGPADAESHFDEDGTIVWVLTKTKMEPLPFTRDLYNIVGEARALIGTPVPVSGVPGLVTVVDDTPAGFYTQRGNASCAGSGRSLLGVGSLPAGLLMLFALAALVRRRH
jgi:hypothetical protein